MPAVAQAVSKRPWIAPTICVPNKSAKYAGIVAKPPPYILKITQKAETNKSLLPAPALAGILAYKMPPNTKNTI